jgi:hypothetical protein
VPPYPVKVLAPPDLQELPVPLLKRLLPLHPPELMVMPYPLKLLTSLSYLLLPVSFLNLTFVPSLLCTLRNIFDFGDQVLA